MKNYSSTTKANSRRTSNKRLPLVVIGGVAALVLFFVGAFVVKPLAELALAPVVYVQSWVRGSEAALPSLLRDRTALSNQIAELRQTITEKDFDSARIAELQAENAALEALLGVEGEQRTVAHVIAKPGTVPFDTMVIDKGSNEGIAERAPVFIGESVAIGYVEKVFPETSVVTLATSPGVESTVYVLGPDIYTTALGQGGGVLRVGVPQGIDLKEGNEVILPTLSSAVFGMVVSIDSEPARAEQYGFVTLEDALSTVYIVSVGTAPVRAESFSEVQDIIAEAKRDLLKVEVPPEFMIDTATTSSSTASTTLDAAEGSVEPAAATSTTS